MRRAMKRVPMRGIARALVLAGVVALSGVLAPEASARIGLVTLPRRDAVQVTIYNSADVTLVRERRTLTMGRGENRLEFSWVGTLIDPTSVEFKALTNAEKVELVDVSFPASAPNALVWHVRSEIAGPVEVEITYFTSGLSWSADYEAVVAKGAPEMELKSYVEVANNSGETYDDAEVRLIVGTIRLVESISDLANRGGRPIPPPVASELKRHMGGARPKMMALAAPIPEMSVSGSIGDMEMEYAPPEIEREELSEYYIYTVGGRHEVTDEWSCRWPNFTASGIPVQNFYKFEEGRWDPPRRFLKLRNSKEHRLGEEPLPDGTIHVYRLRDDGTRAFVGSSVSKYVPVGEDWEIEIGADPDVLVKPTLGRWWTENVEFDPDGEPSGWDLMEEWTIEVINSSAEPVTVRVDRNFAGDFTLGNVASREMYDLDTARFVRELAPRSRSSIAYSVTTRKGTRNKR